MNVNEVVCPQKVAFPQIPHSRLSLTSPTIIMSLLQLPAELLGEIIRLVMPEGFESMALSCKQAYLLCSPLFARYNKLRKHFDHVECRDKIIDISSSPHEFSTAYDLIDEIAVDPIIARYIRSADFGVDEELREYDPYSRPFDAHGLVAKLMAGSLYLKQAGLDWKLYYASVKEYREQKWPNYSQHAMAFILTLLPNIKKITLPQCWWYLDQTERLIDNIVHTANEPQASDDGSSLAGLTQLHMTQSEDFRVSNQLIGLPKLSFIEMSSCSLDIMSRSTLKGEDICRGLGTNITSIHIVSCDIGEAPVNRLLGRTPRLKQLRWRNGSDDMEQGYTSFCPDVYKFMTTIEQQIGRSLVDLDLDVDFDISELKRPSPSIISMRGLQHLRRLKFPLEMLECKLSLKFKCRKRLTVLSISRRTRR